MKCFPYLALLMIILLSACGSIPGFAPQTSTPLPTNAPKPTFTPLPTDTPTSTPTTTPDAAATTAAKATLVANDVLSELDKSLGDTDIQYKGKQYQFMFLRFSGLPAWTIEVHEFGQFKNSPTKVKFSDALDLGNGATNQIILVVQDDHFTLYLNKVRQGTYYDYSKQRTEGGMGFLGIQQSGKGNCKFENSWVWALE